MIKTKIMFGALAALFLSVGIFAATNLQEKERVSDLTLANIEAMTQVDDGDNTATIVNGPADHMYCSRCFTTHTYCKGKPKGGQCAHTGH